MTTKQPAESISGSSEIPYDEMRAILGLPKVKYDVERERVRAFLSGSAGQPYYRWNDAADPLRIPDEGFRIGWTLPAAQNVRTGGRDNPQIRGYTADTVIVDELAPGETPQQHRLTLVAAFDRLTEQIRSTTELIERFMNDTRPQQKPPMWAIDPAHTRRRRNR
ncbi:hypothetical protein ACFYVR_15915 [Rhodococcus sp. NPDC003318]|uniref:hypothetical protein n=1 Tax=Rhodococcus sp. NPDC003318 TaxID=3364503 RepID=UPI0036A4CD95